MSELQRAMQKLKTALHSISVADPWVRRRFRSIADAIDRAAVEIERTPNLKQTTLWASRGASSRQALECAYA